LCKLLNSKYIGTSSLRIFTCTNFYRMNYRYLSYINFLRFIVIEMVHMTCQVHRSTHMDSKKTTLYFYEAILTVCSNFWDLIKNLNAGNYLDQSLLGNMLSHKVLAHQIWQVACQIRAEPMFRWPRGSTGPTGFCGLRRIWPSLSHKWGRPWRAADGVTFPIGIRPIPGHKNGEGDTRNTMRGFSSEGAHRWGVH
jgi:hypothetical protein